MKLNNKLIEILNAELKWNKKRMECFVEMLLAIMVVTTTNLSMIANQVVNKTKLKNRYRRLQKFFAGCKINYDRVAKFIFKLFCFRTKRFICYWIGQIGNGASYILIFYFYPLFIRVLVFLFIG